MTASDAAVEAAALVKRLRYERSLPVQSQFIRDDVLEACNLLDRLAARVRELEDEVDQEHRLHLAEEAENAKLREALREIEVCRPSGTWREIVEQMQVIARDALDEWTPPEEC